MQMFLKTFFAECLVSSKKPSIFALAIGKQRYETKAKTEMFDIMARSSIG